MSDLKRDVVAAGLAAADEGIYAPIVFDADEFLRELASSGWAVVRSGEVEDLARLRKMALLGPDYIEWSMREG